MNELQRHAEIYLWWHNNEPDKRGLLCYNLNNVISTLPKKAVDLLRKFRIPESVINRIKSILLESAKIRGNQNRSLGLQKGRSDFALYWNGTAYMIEVKTDDGKQSEDQIKWQKVIEAAGLKYYIVKNLDEFKALWLSIKTN
jgi:hypothetical protein